MNTNNINVIDNSLFTLEVYDVEFTHPDYSGLYTQCAISVYNPNQENSTIDNYEKADIIKAIWNKYNDSYFYHEMIVSTKIILDDEMYIFSYKYNGYDDIEQLPTKHYKITIE